MELGLRGNEMSKYIEETFLKTGKVIKILKAEEAKEKNWRRNK